MFEQLLREEEAHERALAHRHAEVKKRLGLGGAARLDRIAAAGTRRRAVARPATLRASGARGPHPR